MPEHWQQILVGVAVLAAVVYLLRRGRKTACEKGGCGCAKKETQPGPKVPR